ncbi:hypothetical protein HK101_002376 [Irineochytrium annulatum]|nr:hypothetical protein HK101_002376 [Irineochytrium annulatum]
MLRRENSLKHPRGETPDREEVKNSRRRLSEAVVVPVPTTIGSRMRSNSPPPPPPPPLPPAMIAKVKQQNPPPRRNISPPPRRNNSPPPRASTANSVAVGQRRKRSPSPEDRIVRRRQSLLQPQTEQAAQSPQQKTNVSANRLGRTDSHKDAAAAAASDAAAESPRGAGTGSTSSSASRVLKLGNAVVVERSVPRSLDGATRKLATPVAEDKRPPSSRTKEYHRGRWDERREERKEKSDAGGKVKETKEMKGTTEGAPAVAAKRTVIKKDEGIAAKEEVEKKKHVEIVSPKADEKEESVQRQDEDEEMKDAPVAVENVSLADVRRESTTWEDAVEVRSEVSSMYRTPDSGVSPMMSNRVELALDGDDGAAAVVSATVVAEEVSGVEVDAPEAAMPSSSSSTTSTSGDSAYVSETNTPVERPSTAIGQAGASGSASVDPSLQVIAESLMTVEEELEETEVAEEPRGEPLLTQLEKFRLSGDRVCLTVKDEEDGTRTLKGVVSSVDNEGLNIVLSDVEEAKAAEPEQVTMDPLKNLLTRHSNEDELEMETDFDALGLIDAFFDGDAPTFEDAKKPEAVTCVEIPKPVTVVLCGASVIARGIPVSKDHREDGDWVPEAFVPEHHDGGPMKRRKVVDLGAGGIATRRQRQEHDGAQMRMLDGLCYQGCLQCYQQNSGEGNDAGVDDYLSMRRLSSRMLWCSACHFPYHIGCLSPAETAKWIGDVSNWVCPGCRECYGRRMGLKVARILTFRDVAPVERPDLQDVLVDQNVGVAVAAEKPVAGMLDVDSTAAALNDDSPDPMLAKIADGPSPLLKSASSVDIDNNVSNAPPELTMTPSIITTPSDTPMTPLEVAQAVLRKKQELLVKFEGRSYCNVEWVDAAWVESRWPRLASRFWLEVKADDEKAWDARRHAEDVVSPLWTQIKCFRDVRMDTNLKPVKRLELRNVGIRETAMKRSEEQVAEEEDNPSEALVCWKGLPSSEATWEKWPARDATDYAAWKKALSEFEKLSAVGDSTDEMETAEAAEPIGDFDTRKGNLRFPIATGAAAQKSSAMLLAEDDPILETTLAEPTISAVMCFVGGKIPSFLERAGSIIGANLPRILLWDVYNIAIDIDIVLPILSFLTSHVVSAPRMACLAELRDQLAPFKKWLNGVADEDEATATKSTSSRQWLARAMIIVKQRLNTCERDGVLVQVLESLSGPVVVALADPAPFPRYVKLLDSKGIKNAVLTCGDEAGNRKKVRSFNKHYGGQNIKGTMLVTPDNSDPDSTPSNGDLQVLVGTCDDLRKAAIRADHLVIPDVAGYRLQNIVDTISALCPRERQVSDYPLGRHAAGARPVKVWWTPMQGTVEELFVEYVTETLASDRVLSSGISLGAMARSIGQTIAMEGESLLNAAAVEAAVAEKIRRAYA